MEGRARVALGKAREAGIGDVESWRGCAIFRRQSGLHIAPDVYERGELISVM